MMGMKKFLSTKKIQVDDDDDDSDKSQPLDEVLSDTAEPERERAEDQWGDWSDDYSKASDEDDFVPLNDDSVKRTDVAIPRDSEISAQSASVGEDGEKKKKKKRAKRSSVTDADAVKRKNASKRKSKIKSAPVVLSAAEAASLVDGREQKPSEDSASVANAKEKKKKKKETKKKKKRSSRKNANGLDTSVHSFDSCSSGEYDPDKSTKSLKSVNSKSTKSRSKFPKSPTSAKSKKEKRKSIKTGLPSIDIDDGEQQETAGNNSTGALTSTALQDEKKDCIDERAIVRAAPSEMVVLASGDPLTLSSRDETAQSSTGNADGNIQRQEILRLQHQLSEALQKVVMTTEEHIHDKGQFLEVSTELSRLKAGLAEVVKERDSLSETLKERESMVENCMQRIDKLEAAIEKQLDAQDALEDKLERSEDEIQNLLDEIKHLESNVDRSRLGDGDAVAMLEELKDAEGALAEKEQETYDQQERIEFLVNELKNAATVNKLQLDELEAENQGLKGKLKGEKLDATAKLANRDETIASLQKELKKYKGASGAEDLASMREELREAKTEVEVSTMEKETALHMSNKVKGEKEELLERNNIMNEKVKILEKSVKELTEKSNDLGAKVLQWTEKTYEWKSRAESAETKLDASNFEKDSVGGSDVGVEEAPQGLFLQAAMDRKEISNKRQNKWRIFGQKDGEEEELSPEEIRIKTLEERNTSLEDTIAELRSDMVKMQTAHKEEVYSTKKKIAQLQGENDALILKNVTLEKICESVDPSGQ